MNDFFDNIEVAQPTPPIFEVDAPEDIEEDPRLTFDQATIAKLYQRDIDAWRTIFYPGYEGLPFSAVRTWGLVTGTSPIAELAPWGAKRPEDLQGLKDKTAKGAIDPIGKRQAFITVIVPGKPRTKVGDEIRPATADKERTHLGYEVVPIDEYVEWCDDHNHFRNGGISPWNGGPGLNPLLFEGGAWDVRNNSPKPFRYRYPIRCATGTYFGMLGPGKYPYGANSLFFATGDRFPSYISDKWGPEYRDLPSRVSQEQYDEMCWKMALKFI